jgi:glycerophosphoryl diester phosphodiesterase
MRADDYEFFEPPFLAFAHRGGATYGPNQGRENSLHAFQQAVAMGYRYLETDVHATSDGVLVAVHDERLDRVTDRTGLIANMTYPEVKEARIGGVDPIPLFEDLLTAFPEARFNVDAKSPGSVDLLADLIVKHDAYDRVCITSFGIRRLHRLRRRLGRRVPTAASKLGIALNRFAPWLTRLINTPAPALQIPVEYPILGYRLRLFTPALVKAVHAAGKQVHIWTVDDSESMEELIDAGADGIFTDRIDTLKAVLERRSLWSDADPGKPLLPRKRERSAELRGVVPPHDNSEER